MPPKEPRPHDTIVHTEQWLADHPDYQKHSALDKAPTPSDEEIPLLKNAIENETLLWNELERVRATVRELQNELKLLDPVHDAVAYVLVGDLISANMIRIDELQTRLKKS